MSTETAPKQIKESIDEETKRHLLSAARKIPILNALTFFAFGESNTEISTILEEHGLAHSTSFFSLLDPHTLSLGSLDFSDILFPKSTDLSTLTPDEIESIRTVFAQLDSEMRLQGQELLSDPDMTYLRKHLVDAVVGLGTREKRRYTYGQDHKS